MHYATRNHIRIVKRFGYDLADKISFGTEVREKILREPDIVLGPAGTSSLTYLSFCHLTLPL